MKQPLHKENSNTGQMTLVSVIALTAVLTAVTLSHFFIGFSEYSQSTYDNWADQAKEIAESALDNAIYEYGLNNTYAGGTFTSPIGTATVTVSVNNGVSPQQVTITASATYHTITRSETSIYTVVPPPAVITKTAFTVNNMYTDGATLNGEIFTNNDFNFNNSTINGNIYGAGKGNGQKGFITNTHVNQVSGSGGSVNVWDPTWIQTNSLIQGDVNYHTSLHVDNSSTVVGNQNKNSNNFLPPVAAPVFDFATAQTTATANGTYYATNAAFNAYMASVSTLTSGVRHINLPAGMYVVNCSGSECSSPYTIAYKDSGGNPQEIDGPNVSIVVRNQGLIELAGMNITGPYTSGGNYYPVVASNSDMFLLSATSTSTSIALTGIVFANGTINGFGINPTHELTITGAIWAANQINLYPYTVVNFDSQIVSNSAGFNYPNNLIDSIKWQENP